MRRILIVAALMVITLAVTWLLFDPPSKDEPAAGPSTAPSLPACSDVLVEGAVLTMDTYTHGCRTAQGDRLSHMAEECPNGLMLYTAPDLFGFVGEPLRQGDPAERADARSRCDSAAPSRQAKT